MVGGGAAGSGGSDRRRVELIGSALVQRGGNRACLGPGEPYHGMEPIGFYWAGVLGVDPGASPLPRAGNRNQGESTISPKRACSRQGGHRPSSRHETSLSAAR